MKKDPNVTPAKSLYVCVLHPPQTPTEEDAGFASLHLPTQLPWPCHLRGHLSRPTSFHDLWRSIRTGTASICSENGWVSPPKNKKEKDRGKRAGQEHGSTLADFWPAICEGLKTPRVRWTGPLHACFLIFPTKAQILLVFVSAQWLLDVYRNSVLLELY